MKELKNNEWVLTTQEIANLQKRSYDLGHAHMTNAMRLLYTEAKVQNVLGAMPHPGKELNEMMAGVLLLTLKGRSLFPRPHDE